MKDKKWIKPKIGVGYLVKTKFGNMKVNKREGRRRRTRKEVVLFVQDVVGKNNFLVKFEYGHKRDMTSI